MLSSAVRVHDSRRIFWATFLIGGLVLAYDATNGIVAPRDAANPAQLVVYTIALLCIPLLSGAMKGCKIWQMRLIAGTQVIVCQRT